jgi:CRISPR-associated protein (TIGR02710 family)
VGGKERTKNGLGIVKDGQEEIYDNVNPWDFLAIEERKNIAVLFNQYQFKAAKGLTDSLIGRSAKYRAVFKKIGLLIEGYNMWDLFRHQDAIQLFGKARTDDILEGEDDAIRNFTGAAKNHLKYLKENADAKNKHSSLFQICDLYSNAERRAEEGKVDDAVLRLYRVVEMIAQERLINAYKIDTSDVRADQIPASLSKEFIKKYKDQRSGMIKVPQAPSYILLGALGDDLGKLFEVHQSSFKEIQNSRNDSYLAHGFGSSKEKTYERLRDFILELNVFEASVAPVFPKIRF